MDAKADFRNAVAYALADAEIVNALAPLAERHDDVAEELRADLLAQEATIVAAIRAQADVLTAAQARLQKLATHATGTFVAVSDEDNMLRQLLRFESEKVEQLVAKLRQRETPPDDDVDPLLARHHHAQVVVTERELREARTRRELLIQQLRAIDRSAPVGDDPDAPAAVRDAARAASEAERSLQRALRDEHVFPFCRRWLAEYARRQQRRRFRGRLGDAQAHGLGEMYLPTKRVETRSRFHLERLLYQLPKGGTIGLSGPRGSGKSLLIRSVCGSDWEREEDGVLGVTVKAPVAYAPQDFVLQVLADLCRATLPADEARTSALAARTLVDDIRARTRRFSFGGWVVGIVLGTIGLVITLLGLHAAGLSAAQAQGLLGGTLALALVILAITLSDPIDEVFSPLPLTMLAALTTVALLITADVNGLVAAAIGLAVGVVTLAIPELHGGKSQVAMRGAVAGCVAGGCGVFISTAAIGSELDRTAFVGVALLMFAALIGPTVNMAWDRWDGRRAPTTELGSQVAELRLKQRFVAQRLGLRLALALALVGVGLIALAVVDHPADGRVAAGAIVMLLAGVLAENARYVGERLKEVEEAEVETSGASPVDRYRWWRDDADNNEVDRVARLAREHLSELRFVWSNSTERGAKGGLMLGLGSAKLTAERSGSTGRTSTDKPLSMPEAVSSLHGFLGEVSKLSRRVVIGIDELDKMSAADAEQFLNGIKSIFGIDHVYYLISISEDAVAAFERRGMPFRDVFDSAFDEVVRVEHLPFSGTDALFADRTENMPASFQALCHGLGGGLPREIIRLARRVFDLRQEGRLDDLAALGHALTEAELVAKRDGTVTAARHLAAEPASTAVLGWLAEERPLPDIEAFRTHLAALPTIPLTANADNTAPRALERLLHEYAAYWYLCATVTEMFNESLTPERGGRLVDAEGLVSIEQLARARQALAIDARLAWKRISDFREEWTLDPLVLPVAGAAA